MRLGSLAARSAMDRAPDGCRTMIERRRATRDAASRRFGAGELSITVVDQDGKPFDLGGRTMISLCRCGQSSKKPF